MNDHIKRLMEQTLDEKFAGTWSVMDLEDLTKFADRFAELIVRECSYRCYLTGEYQMAHELSDLYGFKFDFKKMMEEDDE